MGMAPITGENAEYEFSVVFDLGMDHSASIGKDRTRLFDGKVVNFRTDNPGGQIKEWLESGAPVVRPSAEMVEAVAQVFADLEAAGDKLVPAMRSRWASLLARGVDNVEAQGILDKCKARISSQQPTDAATPATLASLKLSMAELSSTNTMKGEEVASLWNTSGTKSEDFAQELISQCAALSKPLSLAA